MHFSFVPLSDLERVAKDAVIDVLGVVKEVGDLAEILSKTTKKPYSKRDISIVDSSGSWVRCTVWGTNAQTWDIPPDTVVAFKGVKVSDFGGRSLSMLFSSTMTVNPDIDEAHSLKGWYDGQGARDLSTYSGHAGLGASLGAAQGRNEPYKTLQQVKDEGLGTNPEKDDYFTTKATILFIRHNNFAYPACQAQKCNKKVLENEDGTWRCERCQMSWPKAEWRYIMSIAVVDALTEAWLNCFDDVGRIIMLGRSADEVQGIKEQHQINDLQKCPELEKCFTDALCQTFVFRCRAKQDTYNDVARVRYQVLGVSHPDHAAEAAKLLEQIKLYG